MNQALSFGGFVRQRRRELDLTQDELARRVGCAAITLRKIEADDLRASVQIAERLAMALAIPLEERSEFVRRARAVRPESSELPQVTPPPSMEEIGREDLTGRAIRGYALAERIGMGGMGSVYRAVQPNVEREVAIKIILPVFANHPDFIRRFEAEAQLVARLEHPHIVPLYDYWREPGVAFLVMRLLRGGNIQNLLKQGSLPIKTTAHLLEQICAALNAAHRIGVIHRDLKPANVLLDEDSNAYLADFGIAKNLGNPDLENQTHADAIIGSPQYMSPEQIRSLSVRPETDIYCLGVMLYEMLTGTLPFTGPTPFDVIQQHINTPLPPLSARRAGLPAALDAVITRATAKDPDERFPDTQSFFNQFRQAIGQLVDARPTAITYEEEDSGIELANPFKGLRAFNEADAENFFGRETLIQQLLARLGEGGELSRFLAVIGPSGSGKSSVVRAGLIPALRRGGLPGSENWFVVDMLPGKHPFEELEASLLRVAVNPPQSLLSQLKDGNRGLLRAVHRILPADESVELVLVIDQFEEVFTLVEDEAERALLLESIAAAAMDERSRLRVIITLRADFTDKPLRYVDFGEMMNRRFEFILPLTADEVERAVAGPAQRAGLRLEKGLVSTIIREAGNQPGTLPMLQHALSELFEKREGRTLTNKAYHEIGGVLGALGRSAEVLYVLLDEAEQTAARQLFLRLVTLGEGTEDTRRRVLREELEGLSANDEQLSVVIGAFGRARLLSFDRDPITRGATIEVAHEALLREWTRLRDWLNESRADVRIQRQLATAAHEWQKAEQDASFLLTGARLDQFEAWGMNTTIALTQDERAFLNASIDERNRRESEESARQQRELENAQKLAETERQRAEEQTRSAGQLRKRAVYLTGAFIVALIMAIVAIFFAQEARNQESISFSRELAVQAKLNLSVDPERSILLALAALDQAHTQEAENVLHEAVSTSRLRMTLLGHEGAINDVIYSPDGKLIASAGHDGTARLWETSTGNQLFILNHPAVVNHVSFSSNGERLATSAADGRVRLWDVASGQELNTIIATTGEIMPDIFTLYSTFSPDGKLLATADRDESQVRFWDPASGRKLFAITHPDWLDAIPGSHLVPTVMAFSSDGTHLAVGLIGEGVPGSIEIWDVTAQRRIQTLRGQMFFQRPFSFNPDGTRIATPHGPDGRGASVWDVTTGNLLFSLRPGPMNAITYSADGKRLLTASGGGVSRVLDAETGEELLALVGHPGRIYRVAESPDCIQPPQVPFEWCGRYLATAGDDGSVRIWDVSPLGTAELLTMPGDDFAMYADGKRISVLTYGTFPPAPGSVVTIQEWGLPVKTRTEQTYDHLSSTINLAAGYQRAWFYPADGILVGAFEDGSLKFWDVLDEGKEIYSVECCIWAPDMEIAFSSRHKPMAAFAEPETGTVIIQDLITGSIAQTLQVAGPNELVSTFHPVSSGHGSLVLSPGGERLAILKRDRTVETWDVKTGSELQTLPGPAVLDGAAVWFNRDGTNLVTTDCTGTAVVHDTRSGEEINRFSNDGACITDVAFGPDEKLVAVNSLRRQLKIWDLDSGREVLTLPGGGTVRFTPDGTQVIVAREDFSALLTYTVNVYLLQVEDLVTQAKARLTRSLTIEECRQYLHMDTCPIGP